MPKPRDHRTFSFLTAILLITLCAVVSPSAGETPITGYRSLYKVGRDSSGQVRVAIRQYDIDSVRHFLLVDPLTLETSTAPAAAIDFSGPATPDKVQDTPYARALARYTSPPYKLQNHGAVHAELPVDGMFLTVDMCPSQRPFERAFFETIAGLARENGRATPVAIAMTGAWLEHHRDELSWIKRAIRENKLAVTWVNHSYSHFYAPKTPLEQNFLLAPGTDFEQEVLATEQLMLENGLVPSPFFRFPGLVAGGRLLAELRRLSLIPVGSDAWLAKGETPKKGSFILVHGNGNEPPGIAKVLPLLGQKHGQQFLPLRAAFAAQESGGARTAKE